MIYSLERFTLVIIINTLRFFITHHNFVHTHNTRSINTFWNRNFTLKISTLILRETAVFYILRYIKIRLLVLPYSPLWKEINWINGDSRPKCFPPFTSLLMSITEVSAGGPRMFMQLQLWMHSEVQRSIFSNEKTCERIRLVGKIAADINGPLDDYEKFVNRGSTLRSCISLQV